MSTLKPIRDTFICISSPLKARLAFLADVEEFDTLDSLVEHWLIEKMAEKYGDGVEGAMHAAYEAKKKALKEARDKLKHGSPTVGAPTKPS